MSVVQQAIEVGAPLHTVYEQIAAFENYPRFMTGVRRVTPIGPDQTHWVMEVDGHRREFDAQITERSLDQRVSWSTMDGPRLAETITLRPMGETRTQVVAQMEADIAFLMPSDRHGQETLNRRLKDDLATFKGLVESGVMGSGAALGAAGSKQLAGRSGTMVGTGAHADPASPASVAARIRKRTAEPDPGAGRGTGGETIAETAADTGDGVEAGGAPGLRSAADPADAMAPGRRIVGRPGAVSGSAPMGGRTPTKDTWGDGMLNEEDRGSAEDY